MKKLLLVCFVILLCANINAQKIVLLSQVYCSSSYNASTQDFDPWSDWTKGEIIITIDMDNDNISINNQFDDKFKLMKILNKENGTDSNDDDPYLKTTFKTIDKDGKEPDIYIKLYDSGVYHIGIFYSNYKYLYQCKKVEF